MNEARLDDSVTTVSAYEVRTGVSVKLDGKWRFLAMKHVTDDGEVTLRTYTGGTSKELTEHRMPHTQELETRIMYGIEKPPPKRRSSRR